MEEMEEQLLSMGFPPDLVSQSLAATGSDSVGKAAEWILNLSKLKSPNISSTPPPPCQPKLERFFHLDPSSRSVKPTTVNPPPQPQQNQNQSVKKRKVPPVADEDGGEEMPSVPLPPLAERMRPRTIYDVVGQDHLLGEETLIRSALCCNRLPSLILWGPPGSGKTTIARAIVNSSSSPSSYRFVPLSAVTSGVKDVRDAVDQARKQMKLQQKSKRTVLFVDEVHRFNKSQQDSFLPVIEDGSIVFIGATTENPSFHLITPLLSRCRVLTLNPLQPRHVETLLRRAVADQSDKGLARSIPGKRIHVNDDALEFLSNYCDGDARVALNALEISAVTAAARLQHHGPITIEDSSENRDYFPPVTTITINEVKEAMQSKHLAYDRAGEQHYNLISALHKSMRGSDADAAIYWLARMLEGGEEPLYIARRLIQFSSEDIGLADPCALTQAVACYQACHFIGMPECKVNLAQCVAYLALAPKSVAAYRALEAALKVVRESVGQNEGVPLHLRNAPTKLMKDIGYGKGYIYPPDNPNSSQSYLPPSLEGSKFLYWPPDSGTDT